MIPPVLVDGLKIWPFAASKAAVVEPPGEPDPLLVLPVPGLVPPEEQAVSPSAETATSVTIPLSRVRVMVWCSPFL